MQPTQEVWRRVAGSSIHWISSLGRVWSDHSKRLLHPSTDHYGYLVVGVGGRGNQKVHRLVAFAFLGEPAAGMEVRHLNGCRSDNRLENLAWGTRAENNFDKIVHGTHHYGAATHCVHGHEFTPENTKLRTRDRGVNQVERVCLECRRVRHRRLYHMPDPLPNSKPRNSKATESKAPVQAAIQDLNRAKTECLRGHPFTPENTYIEKYGSRRCIACRRERVRALAAQKK